MAQPLPFSVSPQRVTGDEERLRNAPAEHTEAILSAYDLLQVLHDRGVLNLLRGAVGAGDQLVETLTEAVDTPESIRAIRNFLLLTKFFSSIPPDLLHSLVQTASVGAKREKAHKAPGLLSILWRLRNEDSRRALAVALDLVEGVGKSL